MAAPLSNIRLAENRKLITTTGEFWVDGKLLGKGKWENRTRFTVFVSTWGDWWVGVLAEGGMLTAAVKTEQDAKNVKPGHNEKFSDISPNAPKTDLRLDENKKLLTRTGEFYGNGKLLGYGRWEPKGRFIVFVSAFDNRWWVGSLTDGGINTAAPKTEEEAKTTNPTHFEKFSVPFPDAPKADVRLTENDKLITPFGEFFGGGALLGLGKWGPGGKFIVFVEAWENAWWVGIVVEGGMKTALFPTQQEAATGVPHHPEQFGRQPDAPVVDVKLTENNKVIKTTGEFFGNGSLLGYGRWEPGGKFIVFVKDFGNLWWVGAGGMNTGVFKTESEAGTGAPAHFEPLA